MYTNWCIFPGVVPECFHNPAHLRYVEGTDIVWCSHCGAISSQDGDLFLDGGNDGTTTRANSWVAPWREAERALESEPEVKHEPIFDPPTPFLPTLFERLVGIEPSCLQLGSLEPPEVAQVQGLESLIRYPTEEDSRSPIQCSRCRDGLLLSDPSLVNLTALRSLGIDVGGIQVVDVQRCNHCQTVYVSLDNL